MHLNAKLLMDIVFILGLLASPLFMGLDAVGSSVMLFAAVVKSLTLMTQAREMRQEMVSAGAGQR